MIYCVRAYIARTQPMTLLYAQWIAGTRDALCVNSIYQRSVDTFYRATTIAVCVLKFVLGFLVLNF